MQFRKKHLIALPLASTIGLIACSHGNAGTTSTTAAPPPEMEPPPPAAAPPPLTAPAHQKEIMYLATARCDHQQACNNIGLGKPFASQDACMKQMQAQGFSEEYQRQCPGDVDAQRLQTCASAIKAGICTDATDAINRFDACSAASLCPSMNTP